MKVPIALMRKSESSQSNMRIKDLNNLQVSCHFTTSLCKIKRISSHQNTLLQQRIVEYEQERCLLFQEIDS